MHKKKNRMKKFLAGLAMFGLVASGAAVMAPAANATVVSFPAGGLDFDHPSNVLREAAVNSTFRYTSINGVSGAGQIDAVVTLTEVTNSESRKVAQFTVRWPVGVTAGSFKYRYSLDGEQTWVESSVFDSNSVQSSEVTIDHTTQAGIIGLDDVDVQGWTGSAWEDLPDSSSCTSTPPTNPCYRKDSRPVTNDRLQVFDRVEADATEDDYISAEFRTISSGEMRIGFKIEFLDTNNAPVTFSTLKINAYDVDNNQYVEFENVENYSLTDDTIITALPQNGSDRNIRFKADSTRASTSPSQSSPVHSLGEARVEANFTSVSEIRGTFGLFASGSQQLDFSSGPGWVVASGPLNSPPAPTSLSANASSPQVMSAIDVNPTNITVDNEIITILGANLNTVIDVYIGGIKVPIFTQSGNRLQVRAPKGLSGLVDLELKSSLNDVYMTKKLNYGAVAATGTRKATLIVGGFAHNSRKLTPRMQKRIERWLERNSDLSTLTCTGFTSLPRRTTDVTLSTNRGITACNFSKRQRSELETSVSQGIEDPRPGSNVRRVRLVLTK